MRRDLMGGTLFNSDESQMILHGCITIEFTVVGSIPSLLLSLLRLFGVLISSFLASTDHISGDMVHF